MDFKCVINSNISHKFYINKGNAERDISPRLKIWPSHLDLWPWKSIGFQILLRTKYVPSLVKIHWRMLILECSQGCYGRTDGRSDGSITISLRNFVGEGIIKVRKKSIISRAGLLTFLIICVDVAWWFIIWSTMKQSMMSTLWFCSRSKAIYALITFNIINKELNFFFTKRFL